jgi:hypothetical protein
LLPFGQFGCLGFAGTCLGLFAIAEELLSLPLRELGELGFIFGCVCVLGSAGCIFRFFFLFLQRRESRIVDEVMVMVVTTVALVCVCVCVCVCVGVWVYGGGSGGGGDGCWVVVVMGAGWVGGWWWWWW